MESSGKTDLPQKTTRDEVDLGQLFFKTGGVINNLFLGLNRLMIRISNGFLNLLFFLRRNFVWLVVGTLLGLGYGFYLVSAYGVSYTSDLTVRANFNSTRSLYGSIDYFSSLIGSSKFDELARMLNISPKEAASLRSIEAAPVKSELITAQLYNDQFLDNIPRANRVRTDTFWINTINYKDFKTSLTKYDYPLHEISVTSTDAFIFPKIQQGIINKISSNEFLQQVKTSDLATNKAVVDIITSSIASLDTLRNTYNKRLSSPPRGESTTGNVTLLDGSVISHIPELELYDKLLELKDELKTAKNESVMESNILQIYSPFSSVGQRESFFRQSVVRFSLTGLVLSLIILVAINWYKSLTRLEKAHKERDRIAKVGLSWININKVALNEFTFRKIRTSRKGS
jgi:hypothetical protein